MAKKALAVLLALVLFIGVVPLVSATDGEDGWLVYYEDADESSFTALIVAPAKYTRLSDAPRIETVCTADPAGNGVLTPTAEQATFYWNGKTETHLVLKAVCPIFDGSFPGYSTRIAVLPGSVLDGAGNANARVWFDDETEYRPAEGFIGIDVYSSLLQKNYDREADTVAVGDVLRVDYSGLDPIEIFVNGAKAASLPGGEMQEYTYDVNQTGSLTVVVRQGDADKETRPLTVITSKEMYERNLRDGLITGEDIPSTEDLVDVGIPQGSPFIPLAKLVAFFVAVREFIRRLFSFSRIAD